MRHSRPALVLSLVLLLAGLATAFAGKLVGPFPVTHVRDGDTIEIRINGRVEPVRFLGMDTPETVKPGTPVQPFGPQASAYTKKRLTHNRVWLEFDVQQRDKYRRLLAYVYYQDAQGAYSADGVRLTMINRDLVAAGLAHVDVMPPNVAHADLMRQAAEYAHAHQLGLWRDPSVGYDYRAYCSDYMAGPNPDPAAAQRYLENEPAKYRSTLDRNHDGTACDSYR